MRLLRAAVQRTQPILDHVSERPQGCGRVLLRFGGHRSTVSDCLVSYVLATHNRCSTVVRTIDRLLIQSADGLAHEILVVDNASTDDTGDCLARYGWPVSIIRSARNLGSCGKTLAIDRCRGRYVIFLDDDSTPQPGSVAKMVAHFEADLRLAAAGFRDWMPPR